MKKQFTKLIVHKYTINNISPSPLKNVQSRGISL